MRRYFFIGMGITLAYTALLVINVLMTERDDTDPPDGRVSGLALYTDHGTGCQYLKQGSFGALTPRLGEDGKPLCRKPRPTTRKEI